MRGQAFDIHGDLLICRYKQGVQLAKPPARAARVSPNTLSRLYNVQSPVFFSGHNHEVVDGNDACAAMVDAPSRRDMQGRTLQEFYDRETVQELSATNKNIMQAKKIKILEEEGFRAADNVPLHHMSFKFPVYGSDNKIIGLMGYCIKIDPLALHDFGQAFLALMSTGLLNVTHPSINVHRGIYFSRREEDVLLQLIRGKTARQIAERLMISPRTVEHYIENMKIKTDCISKSELIDKFVDEI